MVPPLVSSLCLTCSIAPCGVDICVAVGSTSSSNMSYIGSILRLRVCIMQRDDAHIILEPADLLHCSSSSSPPLHVLPLYSCPITLVDASTNTPPVQRYCERHLALTEGQSVILRERQGYAELGGRVWTGMLPSCATSVSLPIT